MALRKGINSHETSLKIRYPLTNMDMHRVLSQRKAAVEHKGSVHQTMLISGSVLFFTDSESGLLELVGVQ